MSPASLDPLIHELTAAFGLSPQEVEALRVQGQRYATAFQQLDDLLLDTVEPASLYKVVP